MDIKREREFMVGILKEQNKRASQRDTDKISDVKHKIEVIRLNQQKIQEESKSIQIVKCWQCKRYIKARGLKMK